MSEYSADIRTWNDAQRKTGSLVAFGVALGLIAVGILIYVLAGDVAWLFWSFVALLLLTLVFIILLMVMTATSAPRAEAHAEAHPHAGPAGPAAMAIPEEAPEPMADFAPPASGPRTITLRCGDCGTVFDITDTGERPLYHTCPGCGAEGVLRDPAPNAPASQALAPAPARAPVADVSPAEPRPPSPPVAAPAPVAPNPLQAPRRLKLRCGGCKDVFVIEDTGERPLRRPCPHCGRMGEIR